MSLLKQRTIYMGERVPASIVLDDGRLEVRRVNVELLSLQDSDSDEEGSVQMGGTRKRRRLTNLSPEEKMLRRKLKNRMAAQTARDRKKQKMSELEEALALMEAENQKLLAENHSLKRSTTTLSRENEILKERLHTPEADTASLVKAETTVEEVEVVVTEQLNPLGAQAVCTERLSEPMESAVLVPRQKDSARTIVSLLTVLCIHRVLCAMSLVHCMKSWMGVALAASSNIVEVKRENMSSVELELSPPRKHSLPPWWGSHQKNWNPSMN